jgi:hypothetical protein
MSASRHLLTLWNPSYAEDALDAHLRVLLRWAERSRDPADAASPEEDVYVWWAKIRSPRRDGELPHAAEIAALQSQIDDDVETHLYLTDYRSLYVGQLGEVTADAVLEEEGEAEHAPSYYRGREADFWFRLWDLRRLVADDTPGVIEALGRLRNTRYHDRPVSLYGGMVELPLIVTRDDGARWFADRDLLTSGRLWAERDADLRVDTQRLARELPDNLFGRDVWASLETATRTFLASAEAVFRARRDDPAFDFSGPALEYAKAVETELNALLFPRLRKRLEGAAPKDREVMVDGRRLDLGRIVPHQSLGTILYLLEKDATVGRALGQAFPHDVAGWLRSRAPLELRGIVELRNPAAHSEVVGRDRCRRVRDGVLGIGCEGLLVRVARGKRV